MREIDFHNSSDIPSSALNKYFYLASDPVLYQVRGLKGRTKEVVLQVASSEEIRVMPMADFLRLATQADQ